MLVKVSDLILSNMDECLKDSKAISRPRKPDKSTDKIELISMSSWFSMLIKVQSVKTDDMMVCQKQNIYSA